MLFFPGLHHPSDARHFARCMVSVNALRKRRSLAVRDWLMDSGAFTELSTHGCYRNTPADYAASIRRFAGFGNLLAAVSQDYMCEPSVLAKTGLCVGEHQQLTIERYGALVPLVPEVYVMPVLQGYHPVEYVEHIRQYGSRLSPSAWVGVGSVCKRNSSPREVERVLLAIRATRPDLQLHGFGLKMTALGSAIVRECLHSADSMAWSYAARRQGRNANDWREAQRFAARIEEQRPRSWAHQLEFAEVVG